MKKQLFVILTILGISLFVGIIIISIGIGSIFSQLHRIAGPIVCRGGELDVVEHVDRFRPGETYYSISAYCVDGTTGTKKDVTTLVQVVSGVIYSIIPFVVLLGIGIKSRDIRIKDWKTSEENISLEKAFGRQAIPYQDPDSIDAKLAKLKKLRESNLINDDDYQRKKDEILDDL